MKDVALLGDLSSQGAVPLWGGVLARVVTWKKSVRRRLAIGGAGLTIGAAILFVAAVTPAFAHTPQLSGRTVCSNGSHVVTWSIGNDFNLPMTITSATATRGNSSYPVTGYHATVGASGSPSHATPARTVVPASATGLVTLRVHVRWSDGFTKTGSTSVRLIGPCMGPTTSTTPSTLGTTTSSVGSQGSTLPPPTTTSSVGSQGSTLPPPTTTSTVGSLGSTQAPPTTAQPGANSAENGGTPIGPLGGPSGPPSGTSITQQLPFTGSGYAGPIIGAGSLVLGGIAVAIGSARRRRRETV
jgi:hypothetical protein